MREKEVFGGRIKIQQGWSCKRVAVLGVCGAEHQDDEEVFKEMFNKSMNNLQVFETVKGNLVIFWKFFKFYRNFHENFGKNLENFGNMHLSGVCGEIIRNIVEKSMKTCKLLEIFY